MPGRLRTAALLTALWSVGLAAPAAANVLHVPASTPAAGKVDVTTFDVVAAGAKAPRSVKVTATLPAIQRKQFIVLVATHKTKAALHVMVVVAHRGRATT